MTRLNQYHFLLLIMLFFSCHEKNNQKIRGGNHSILSTKQTIANEIDSLRFSTGACEGTCPVYTITIFENNTARFEGGAFSGKTGVYTSRLKQASFSNIISLINRYSIDTLKNEYNDGTVDVQSCTLDIYYKNGRKKSILDMQMHGTKALTQLYAIFEKMYDEENWVKEN